MNWKTKARIQSLVARLPDRWLSYSLYFQLQRRFGGMRPQRINPTGRLLTGMEICRQVIRHQRSPTGSTFFEVGTGWRLNLPIACWLCGADRVVTMDLNPYLRFSLIREDLHFLQQHEANVFARLQADYGDMLKVDRWRRLLTHQPDNAADLCRLCNIEYHAPADARLTRLPADSIDFHISCNVFEHIPRDVLQGILTEANRIVKPTGLLLHRVDHTDHFSHADSTISPIHFLQYNDDRWRRYADNRYAYVNRLREDDYVRLFQECGQAICSTQSHPDSIVLELLECGFSLDARFADKPPEVLSRLTSLFVLTSSTVGKSACTVA